MSSAADVIPQTDATDDSNGIGMRKSLVVKAERNQKLKRGKKKLKKIINIIGKVIVGTLIQVSRWLSPG